MKSLAVFAFAFLLIATVAAEQDKYRGPSEEDVIVLDADTLEPTIYQSDQTWLLELYAPWCGHCKTLRPEWAKLATKMKGIAKVAKIDASIHRKFDQVYGLKGYPHVVLIPAGNLLAIQVQKIRRFTITMKELELLIVSKSGLSKKSNKTKVSLLKD